MSKNLALLLVVALGAGATHWRFTNNQQRRAASGFEDDFSDKTLTEKASLYWTVVRWPGPRLAPHGTLYVLRYVSVPTETGPVGLLPGEAVRVVREAGAKVQAVVAAVTGPREIELAADDLTDNLDLLARVQRRDEQAHAAYHAQFAAETAERERVMTKLRADAAATAAQFDRVRVAAVAASATTIGSRVTPLHQGTTPIYSRQTSAIYLVPVYSEPAAGASGSSIIPTNRPATATGASAKDGTRFGPATAAQTGVRSPTYTTWKPGSAPTASPSGNGSRFAPGQ